MKRAQATFGISKQRGIWLRCFLEHSDTADWKYEKTMPRRNDIQKILVIGSGPIVIGQSAEFDYSGTQACKALKQEGYEVVLVNSNPATIMTDPELADRTYIEPLTREYVEEIIRIEAEMLNGRTPHAGKFALLPTVGGQTALNLAVDLADAGVLDRYNVELIGAKLEAIKKAEDRLLFKDAMIRIGLEVPKSALVNNLRDGLDFASKLGFPVLIRPSFTLGGIRRRHRLQPRRADGDPRPRPRSLARARVPARRKRARLEGIRARGDARSRRQRHHHLLDRKLRSRWACTPATPSPWLPRKPSPTANIRRCATRPSPSCARSASRPAGRTCSSPSIPLDGRMTVIEMNPRVSRSSALASKATGFPIAKIAAKLAVGYTLDEIPNDITRKTPPASSRPSTTSSSRFPSGSSRSFPAPTTRSGPQMKSVGEVMAIGRTFKEALMKAWRALETGKKTGAEVLDPRRLTQMLVTPRPERLGYIRFAFERGMSVREVARLTGMDPWFLHQIREITLAQMAIAAKPTPTRSARSSCAS